MNARVTLRCLSLAACCLVGLPAPLFAFIPPYLRDEHLLEYCPVIVIAKWNKAPADWHAKKENGGIVDWEVRTEIEIKRVIKGDVKPGKQPLLLRDYITWSAEGGRVSCGTSSHQDGDVNDVCEDNLWFLRSGKSWDDADRTEYLEAFHYRCAQPLVLEPYFAALADPQCESAVPKLLASREPLVVRRALKFVAGGSWPWPYEPRPWDHFSPPGKLRPAQAKSVADLLSHYDPETRRLATAVYVALAQRDSIPAVRRLLDDPDLEIRAIAAGTLAQYRDDTSTSKFATAMDGSKNASLECKIIARFGEWKNDDVVEALIGLIEDDRIAYTYGDEIGMPALKARVALHNLTGCWFPYDAEACLQAWRLARQVPDGDERRQRLKYVDEGNEVPLDGKVILDGGRYYVEVRNVSLRRVSISRLPSEVSLRTTGSLATNQHPPPKVATDFVTLEPGSLRRIDEPIRIRKDEFRQGSTLRLSYFDLGKRFGQHAWLGSILLRLDNPLVDL